MAKAYKCDHCSALYEKFDNVTIIKEEQVYFTPEARSTEGHVKKDFCKKCIIRLCESHINNLKIKGVKD